MKILFAASEATPFVKTGGLADVAGALPKYIAKDKDAEVCVFLPYYKVIKENPAYGKYMKFITSFYTPLSWRMTYTGIFRYKPQFSRVTYYFVDNEYYFGRDKVYGYYDDGESFAFFCKAILESLQHIDFMPDIIHCNDWQTALIPIFYKLMYQHYGRIRTVLTIHNIEYQGKAPLDFAGDVLGIAKEHLSLLHHTDCVNVLKSGIVLADKITTVSETYAKEILDPFYAHGLDGILRENSYKLCGIVNGLDMNTFNPAKDPALCEHYTSKNTNGKAVCKLTLLNELGLRTDPLVPTVAMISRLVAHKGLDLLGGNAIDRLMNLNINLIVLGSGEPQYEDMLRYYASRYPDRISVNIRFDSSLASRIYAGADMFLMPSRSEPCGLSQLVAMRYGAIPIVHETGGLKDTVPAFNPETGDGLGFTFIDHTTDEMIRAVARCTDLYNNDHEKFAKLRSKVIANDCGWDKPARAYIDVYNSMMKD